MIVFDIERFKNEKIGIECFNQQEWDAMIEIINSAGINQDSISSLYYNRYNYKVIVHGWNNTQPKDIYSKISLYGDKKYIESKGWKVIPFREFTLEKKSSRKKNFLKLMI